MKPSSPAATPPLDAAGLRVAIVVSRFNEGVTTRLRDGAEAALLEAGVSRDDITVYQVPGAFELPFAARAVALARRVDAVVCLGCVIRGETPHFEYVASAAANGIMSAQMGAGVPMAFGVLTTNTQAEADARSGPGDDNKGREAARVAIEMALFGRLLTGSRVPLGLRA